MNEHIRSKRGLRARQFQLFRVLITDHGFAKSSACRLYRFYFIGQLSHFPTYWTYNRQSPTRLFDCMWDRSFQTVSEVGIAGIKVERRFVHLLKEFLPYFTLNAAEQPQTDCLPSGQKRRRADGSTTETDTAANFSWAACILLYRSRSYRTKQPTFSFRCSTAVPTWNVSLIRTFVTRIDKEYISRPSNFRGHICWTRELGRHVRLFVFVMSYVSFHTMGYSFN